MGIIARNVSGRSTEPTIGLVVLILALVATFAIPMVIFVFGSHF